MPDLYALSPAAQAVMDAMRRSYDHEPTRRALAAGVLRAVADQVVPHPVHPSAYRDCCEYSDVQTRVGIRSGILAIAAELSPEADHA